MAQNGIEAIVERLKGWNNATPTDPGQGGRRVAWLAARSAAGC
jgi:hypothetical protein